VNTAVSWWDPTVKVVVVCDAVPLATATASPILVAPSLNCTVPAAVIGETVAARTTELPWTGGVAVEDALSVVLVGAAPETVNGTGGDVDGPYSFGFVGVNTAVNWCDPTDSVDVDVDAVPLLTATRSPMLVLPSLNCIVPVAADGLSVAVSVTVLPWVTGDAAEVLTVTFVGVAPAMAKGTAGDVDGPNRAGSEGVNTALSWCDPTVNVDVVCIALPLLTITGSPMLALPSWNCTVPVAAAGVTDAVIINGAPCGIGEAEEVVSTVLVAVA
jgi:hypothetical protein